jgi:hypothetical protein
MPPPTLTATSAYLVAAWPALGLALIVADRSACWQRDDGRLVAWVRVGRT